VTGIVLKLIREHQQQPLTTISQAAAAANLTAATRQHKHHHSSRQQRLPGTDPVQQNGAAAGLMAAMSQLAWEQDLNLHSNTVPIFQLPTNSVAPTTDAEIVDSRKTEVDAGLEGRHGQPNSVRQFDTNGPLAAQRAKTDIQLTGSFTGTSRGDRTVSAAAGAHGPQSSRGVVRTNRVEPESGRGATEPLNVPLC